MLCLSHWQMTTSSGIPKPMKLKDKLAKAKRVKWDDRNYIRGYRLAQEGLSNVDLAQTFGISTVVLKRWLTEKPGFAYAIEEGRKRLEKGGNTLQRYIFKRLSPELRRLWRKIKRVETEPNSVIRIQRMLANKGEDLQKHLFLHVLSVSLFNPSQACKRLCIKMSTVTRWAQEDMNFAMLMEEMKEHKDNFIEGAFMQLVAEKNPQVVMMAAKSKLKHRGYGDKVEIEHSGSLNHNHMTDLSLLSLPLQKAVLAELREIEYKNRNEVSAEAVEVTPVSVKVLENKGG